jgi:hypothetical protein
MSEVNVTYRTQRIIVNHASQSVSVISTGPPGKDGVIGVDGAPGPPGPTGPTGPAGPPGAGTEEVFVGPNDPIATDPTIELWYDTDDVAVMTDDMRWNTAWGLVGKAEIVATTAGIGAIADIPGLSVTFNAVAGRDYLVKGYAMVFQQTTAGITELRLTNVANVQWQACAFSLAASAYSEFVIEKIVSGLAAGPQTFKLRGVTTAGTMITQNTANSPAFICVIDVGPTVGAVPAVFPDIGCRIRRVAVQLLTTGGGAQDIIFDTEDVDTHGFFTAPSGVATIPAGQAGTYLIGGQISAAANTGTTCYADLKIGGTVVQRIPAVANASPPFPMFMVNLIPGNTIGVAAFHSAGVSVNFTANMIVQKVGAL